MHTATQLDAAAFAFRLDGSTRGLQAALPGWTVADRFGIVVDRPYGSPWARAC
ncbi:hypothetical protein JCM18899A_06530 [Nocardioides sp. AN3]